MPIHKLFLDVFPQLSPTQVGETLSFSRNSLSFPENSWVFRKILEFFGKFFEFIQKNGSFIQNSLNLSNFKLLLSRKTEVWANFCAKSINFRTFLSKKLVFSWQIIEFLNYLLEFFKNLLEFFSAWVFLALSFFRNVQKSLGYPNFWGLKAGWKFKLATWNL